MPTLAENPGFSGNEGEIRRETDSLLEGDGFELPVRGRGQSDCRHFVQPAAFDRVRAAAGWTIGRRAVPSLVVRRQGD